MPIKTDIFSKYSGPEDPSLESSSGADGIIIELWPFIESWSLDSFGQPILVFKERLSVSRKQLARFALTLDSIFVYSVETDPDHRVRINCV